MILALAGGVGGSKLALGLSRILPADQFAVVVNTGDDFVHLGLHISPDVDTVTYTLAGIENPDTGWGLAGETWSFMQMAERLGTETWFQLGDRDLATHIERSRRLAEGERLSGITRNFCERLKVRTPVWPMTDDPVHTMVISEGRRIAFQEYFVRWKCAPVVSAVVYCGAERAAPLAELMELLGSPTLKGIVICPSNPYLSIGPMLAMPALKKALQGRSCPAVAVSPIVAGQALKGPAAKLMVELGRAPSCIAVAEHYRGLVDHLLIDRADASAADAIRALGLRPTTGDIVMRSLADRERLARECCALLRG